MITLDERALKKEISRTVEKLRAVAKALPDKEVKKMLIEAAKPIVDQARSAAPVSKRIHKRWKDGKHVATYHPGNLRRSIKVLRGGVFRKTKNVFIGPALTKDSTGVFRGKRVDAYYAHMVEFGTSRQPGRRYMQKGFNRGARHSLQIMKKKIKEQIESAA